MTVAKRLTFEDYYSFIVTDFFEGLHYGHYPKQCGVCNRYFLMTSARKQKYCNGFSPYMLRGKRTTCRKYAASIKRKERQEDNPVVAIYEKRASAIRAEKSRGTITSEFASMATFIDKTICSGHRKVMNISPLGMQRICPGKSCIPTQN